MWADLAVVSSLCYDLYGAIIVLTYATYLDWTSRVQATSRHRPPPQPLGLYNRTRAGAAGACLSPPSRDNGVIGFAQ